MNSNNHITDLTRAIREIRAMFESLIDVVYDEQSCAFNVTGNIVSHYLNTSTFKYPVNIANGSVTVVNTSLTSLKNFPRYVADRLIISYNYELTNLDYFPEYVGGDFYCLGNKQIPRTELYKIVDKVKGNIYYTVLPEDKDQLRRERDKRTILRHNELGNLDV